MTRVVQKLSVESHNVEPTHIPLYLTSTPFFHVLHGKCVAKFKERLGLEESEEPLMVLRNVVMRPLVTISTNGNFKMKEEESRTIVKKEVRVCQARNSITPNLHSFWARGRDQIFLSYRPMFHIAKHRRQIFLAICLAELLDNGVVSRPTTITITPVLKNRPLDATYPSCCMPFYLYGSPQEAHIDHVLVRSPDIVLSADSVTLTLDDGNNGDDAVVLRSKRGQC
ncbi:hypothetical protein N657DRAFT_683668 [Parathielavia appendiculata]|uniref:Uncharacterized protein n=1 Tax=Parathielavia appendiculata TaxID=2587402 RepID=A0AAN6TTA9_9PEZI|nr:hypothetical protein N657DRAFT_683668 [Parathielavia appendiculata]